MHLWWSRQKKQRSSPACVILWFLMWIQRPSIKKWEIIHEHALCNIRHVYKPHVYFHWHQAVSIVGEEVFSFKMTLYPGATEGDGYSDTSKVDGKVILRLGCIQIVYLHKFLMSLLVRTQYAVWKHTHLHVHVCTYMHVCSTLKSFFYE